ncbi:MAG: DUF1559 domain-containing protein [Armatimonadota bacterium]|nr:DUF1559 domain-containing protein [bacterium]
MKTSSRSRGFSLVELLTVIAIIAILAAIIFPVMARVKETARQNQCMTNLHQIAMGVQMFKQDNRRYPEALAGMVDNTGAPTTNISNAVALDAAKSDSYLFSEYVKSIKVFHCPSSNFNKTDAASTVSCGLKTYDEEGTQVNLYIYNSYDAYCYPDSSESTGYKGDRHYCTDWANEVGYIADHNDEIKPFDPKALTDPAAKAAAASEDYARQLKFRNPPADTVITWCSYHETRTADSVSGRATVVFLDGSTESVDARVMETCKWRMRQKKD